MPFLKVILHSCIVFLLFSIALNAQEALSDHLKAALARSKADSSRVRILNELAQHWRSSKPDSAILTAKKALDLARQLPDSAGRIEALLTIGDIYHYEKGIQDSALQFFEPARQLAQETGSGDQLAKSIFFLGKAYDALGDKNLAINYFEQALALTNKRALQFEILYFMAKTYMYSGRNEEAEPYLLQALQMQKENGDKNYQARVLQSLGNNAAMANDLTQALAYYNQGITLAQTTNNREREAGLISMIAYSYLQMGYYTSALENYQRVLKISQSQGDPVNITESLTGIGHVYQGMKAYDKSIAYYEQALKIAEENHLQYHVKEDILENIGRCYASGQDHEKALSFFFRVLSLKQTRDTGPVEVIPLSNIGNTYEKLNELDSAVIYQEKALLIARKFDDIHLQIPSLISLGRAYQKQGQTDQAVLTLEQAVALAQEKGLRQQEMEGRTLLFQLFKKQQNFPQALYYLETAKALQDSLFNEKNAQELGRLEANYAFEEERKEIAFAQQTERAKQKAFRRNLWIALIVAGLFIFAISWYYWQKQKANRVLENLNKEILQQKALVEQQAEQLLELDQVKSRFFTNISHEFRTPLTVIGGMMQQIMKSPDQFLPKGGPLIIRNNAILLNLVNQILDLRKLESGAVQLSLIQGNVIPFLSYIFESFHSLAESKGIRLHFMSDEEEILMDYDKEKLLRIVTNLLSNAIKFTPDGGDVYLTVRSKQLAVGSMQGAGGSGQTHQAHGQKKKPSSNELPTAYRLLLTVKDTGIGIPPEQLPYIFDRFYQVDDSDTRKGELARPHGGGGTGIGLALTKELVKLMEGSIEVKSEEGKGSTFKIFLPIRRVASMEQSEERAVQTELNLIVDGSLPLTTSAQDAKSSLHSDLLATTVDQSTLLIIEDNADVVEYLESLLEDRYQLEIARNGQEGIEVAIERVPDLILSDVMMPIKDGFEVCETLKNDERTSHIPIVLLTAKADADARLAGLQHDADAYLAKPFNPGRAFHSLRKIAST